MSDLLYVGTRKGLFRLERDGSGAWRVKGADFLGVPVPMLLPGSGDGLVHAALGHGHFGIKMHRSKDGGRTWEESAAPAFPPDQGEDAPSVELIWSLESDGENLWAGTIPGGLFRSSDGGAGWELVRSLWDRPERSKWMGGGYDKPGIHSICIDPRDSARITLGVSVGGIWATTDGGETWEVRGRGLWAAYMPPEMKEDPEAQDPHRVVQCAAAPDTLWTQHHNGVFRSNDLGSTWREIENVPPSVFGFAAAVHPSDPDTAWLVPAEKDECRIPVDGKMVVARTRDGGGSFEDLREGLPQEHAYDLVFRHALDVDGSGDRLAMGSTSGSLWISDNGGDSWSEVSQHLPPVYVVRFAC